MKEIMFVRLLSLAFRQNLPVLLSGFIVSFLGRRLLFLTDFGRAFLGLRLFLPALIDGLQAPFGRAFADSDRLIAHQDKHGVRVTGGKDSQANPAALFDRHFKGYILFGAIGLNFLFLHGMSVDDNL